MNIENIETTPGVKHRGIYYRERNIHLISNFRGLDSILKEPMPDRELTLAYIPTASTCYDYPNKFLGPEKKWLNKKSEQGRIKYFEYDITEKTADEIYEKLKHVDIMFFTGGNAPHLLQVLQDNESTPAIKQLVKEGVWYLGKSASAILAGLDIKPRGYLLGSKTTRELTDTKGLALVNAYPFPHADNPKFLCRRWQGKTGHELLDEMDKNLPTIHLLDKIK